MNEVVSEAVVYCRVSHAKQKSDGDGLHSVRRATIEQEFEQLIARAEPCEGIREAAVVMFRHAWDLQARSVDDRVTDLRKNLHDITTQVDHLLDRIAKADAPTLLSAYERRIRLLEEEKLVLEERIATASRRNHGVSTRHLEPPSSSL